MFLKLDNLNVFLLMSTFMISGCNQPEPAAARTADSEVRSPQSQVTDTAGKSAVPENKAMPDVEASTDGWLSDAVTYRCESGETIHALYVEASDTIRLQYRGVTVGMTPAISGSGARFVGGEWVWWTKGMEEGTLFNVLPDDETGEVIETCHAQPESQEVPLDATKPSSE